MARNDFRSPPRDRPGLPLTQYPTPNIEDVIIVEEFARAAHQFTAEPRGSSHPRYPTAKLVTENVSKGDNNELKVRRIYATTRAGQDAYNASLKFVGESATHPVYIRSYILPRPVTRGTRNAPLTSLIGITLGAVGSGYATPPTVAFSGGAGSGATAVAEIQSGAVVGLWLTNGGTGYTSAPTVTITPGGDSAVATAVFAGFGIVSVNVFENGSGYGLGVTATAIGGGGSGATFDVQLTGDTVTGIIVLTPGTGYTEAPLIAISGGGGSGANAVASLSGAAIDSITLDDGGGSYTSAPTVVITGDGTGAAATATLTGGRVSSITLTNGGSGYTGAIISFTGGKTGSGATATALLQETTAVLTDEEITPAPGDLTSIFDQVVRVYSTQPGPVITSLTSYKSNLFWKEARQAVAPGTLPSQPSGVVESDMVRQTSTTEAERITRTLVTSAGATASGFPIYQSARRDERTGVLITTDHFFAAPTYSLPATFVGGSAIAIASSYPTWKQPNANSIGYGSSEYSPVHYVLDARKRPAGENNDLVIVEIDHSAIPSSRVDDSKKRGFTFPAILKFSDEPYYLPNDYAGNIRPPWAIGATETAGYERIAHRSGSWTTRSILTYALGRKEALPQVYRVTTPGTASRIFSISDNTIHNPIVYYETLSTGDIQTVEDIPASTPSTYDSKDILVADAVERQWAGEIYETEVVLISEDTPLSDFPEPVSGGYAVAVKVFTITPAIGFTAATATLNGREHAVMNGRELVVSTTGGATCTATFFGRIAGSDGPVGAREAVSASGTAAATTNTWLSLREVMLSAPLATGSVIVQRAVDPSTAALTVTGTPADGYLITLGLIAGTVIPYQLRTALTSDSITSFTVGSGGSGYLVAPVVTISSGAGTATSTISGGAVVSVKVVNPGTGYDPLSPPTVSFSGVTASVTAALASTSLSGFTIVNGGTIYSTIPTVVLTPTSGGQGAKAVVSSVAVGAITGIALKTAIIVGVDAGSDTLTINAHGLTDGDGIKFSTTGSSTLPSPLSAGDSYVVCNSTANTFKVEYSSGSGAIDLLDTGSLTNLITYCGTGYVTAPTVSFTGGGGGGSGAAATAVISQKNQIKISSTKRTMAARIVQAIGGKSLGANVGTGTVAHPNLKAKVSAADLVTAEFSSTSPTSAPAAGSWTFTVSSGAWNTLTAFTAGGDQDTLCTITAGVGQAFVRAGLGGNLQLFDETNDNDKFATPNLPAAPVLYTDWWAVPAGVSITFGYSVGGVPAVRFAYQTSSTGVEPVATTASVTVTNGLATISSATNLTPYIGCKILIGTDTTENELTSATTLLRTFAGTGGTVTASITNLPATTMGNAVNGHPHAYALGIPGVNYLRLKITQLATPYKFRAVRVLASWPLIP